MLIQLNGEGHQTQSRSLEELLNEMQLAGKQIAIEHNKAIVPRDNYGSVILSEGDLLEIVHFIGGG